jgi:hypothetical protein
MHDFHGKRPHAGYRPAMTKSVLDDAPTVPTHTLPSLAKALGTPDPKLLEALLEGATEPELVALGQSIATPRLLTDDRRLYSTAYWAV